MFLSSLFNVFSGLFDINLNSIICPFNAVLFVEIHDITFSKFGVYYSTDTAILFIHNY